MIYLKRKIPLFPKHFRIYFNFSLKNYSVFVKARINICQLQQFMNFDSSSAIDSLIGDLLALIIMFEKKIEFLKCKLAGNEEFHTRLAFQRLDLNQKNILTPELIYQALRNSGEIEDENDCQFFVRRYSKGSGLTYEQFLRLIAPKGNKVLAQRIMIRTFRKGATLEDYLFKTLLELIQLYVKMSTITESLRKAIQKNQDLNHLQLIQLFHRAISNPYLLVNFLSSCNEHGQQYDITEKDAIYLSYHLRSGNQIHQFSDLDIKELVCPIDMNSQKYVTHRQTFYKQTGAIQETEKYQTKGTNFLGKTYQKMYHQPSSISSSVVKNSEGISRLRKNDREQSGVYKNKIQLASRVEADQSYGGLYIDNFTRSGTDRYHQITQFSRPFEQKNPKVVFEDDYISNNSSLSKGSAFDHS